jgi:hypothetical protein
MTNQGLSALTGYVFMTLYQGAHIILMDAG